LSVKDSAGLSHSYTVQKEWSNEQLTLTGNGVALLTIPNFQSLSVLPDGEVEALSGYHGGHGVESFAVRADGTLFELKYGGAWRYLDAAGWHNADYSVKSFAMTPDGSVVYELKFDGQLNYLDATGWHIAGYGIDSFALSADGAVYSLKMDGTLSVAARTGLATNAITSGVQCFELGFGEVQVYYQTFQGSLYYGDATLHGGLSYFDGTNPHLIENGVAAFHLADGGSTLYALTEGGLLQKGNFNSLATMDTNVIAFDTAFHGTRIYELTTARTLRYLDVGSIRLRSGAFGYRDIAGAGAAPGTFQYYGGDTTSASSFGLAYGGTRVYQLTTAGLFRYSDGSGWAVWNNDTTPGIAFALRYHGSRVYELNNKGALVYDDGFGRQVVDTGVTSFALAYNGTRVYEQLSTGTLKYRDTLHFGDPNDLKSSPIIVSSSVTKFVLGGPLGATVDYLDTSGNLYKVRGTSKTQLATNVDDIQPDPGSLALEPRDKTTQCGRCVYRPALCSSPGQLSVVPARTKNAPGRPDHASPGRPGCDSDEKYKQACHAGPQPSALLCGGSRPSAAAPPRVPASRRRRPEVAGTPGGGRVRRGVEGPPPSPPPVPPGGVEVLSRRGGEAVAAPRGRVNRSRAGRGTPPGVRPVVAGPPGGEPALPGLRVRRRR
jgi:hypothetical protein